eukprot:gb/GECG01015485.1/.p1 GENE.gb/GECG01015485.1/~~gb/GECG01015485.1/.p1  ORF type:complete len:369 (+),score=44.53 gb/GECG01015485.1/:1-1107(+)
MVRFPEKLLTLLERLEFKKCSCTPVSTRWYRAPELLIREKRYDCKVDVWAAGAIMAELYALRPIFNGSSENDQLFKIFNTLEVPPEWERNLSANGNQLSGVAQGKGVALSRLLPSASRDALEVIQHMLKCSPKERASAEFILRLPYFQTGKSEPVLPTNSLLLSSEAEVSERRAREAEIAIQKLMESEPAAETTSGSSVTASTGAHASVRTEGAPHSLGTLGTHMAAGTTSVGSRDVTSTVAEVPAKQQEFDATGNGQAQTKSDKGEASKGHLTMAEKRKRKLKSKRLQGKPNATAKPSRGEPPVNVQTRAEDSFGAIFPSTGADTRASNSWANTEPDTQQDESSNYVPSCLDDGDKIPARRPHPLRR